MQRRGRRGVTARIAGLARANPGTVYAPYSSRSWGREAELLHAFFGQPTGSYTVEVEVAHMFLRHVDVYCFDQPLDSPCHHKAEPKIKVIMPI